MLRRLLVIDEHQIIRAAKAGDSAAFEEIMLMTERQVAQVAWSILGDAEEVKDAMQETFLRVFRHIGRFDEQKNLVAWMVRITVNVCRDALRKRRSRRIFQPLEPEMQIPSGGRSADNELILRSDLALLRRAIDTLPPRERMAVILRDVEGMSTEEVAEALGNTIPTVRVQLSRARAKLRQIVDSWRGRTA